jgi:hypothetical protein
MQPIESITPKPEIARSRVAHLRPGDSVWVFDGMKDHNIWLQIAETVCVEGRMRFRVEGTDFFFEEGLIISYACAPDQAVA